MFPDSNDPDRSGWSDFRPALVALGMVMAALLLGLLFYLFGPTGPLNRPA